MADIIDVNIGDQVLEVFWQDEVELNLDMDLMYIKSGQKEIQDYVDNVSKPEINDYVETEAEPLVSRIVTEIAEPTVNEYLETTVKPEIDNYVEDKKPELQAFVTQAQGFANDSHTSAEASAASAATAETALITLTTTATDNFNTNASEKQAQIDASANAAKVSETNSKASETAAKTSETNSKIWAEGSDSEVTALGGVHSSKVWSETAQEVVTGKQDIANLSQTLDDSTTKYPSNAAVNTAMGVFTYDSSKEYALNDYVITYDESKTVIYRSKVANNTAALTDENNWEKVSLGGGSGLEIGDIGFAPLGIDETQNKRRYLNGQVISQTQFATFTDKVKAAVALYPSLSATEANWQAEVTNSRLGQCGKFVIDDTAGTIRLPKIVNINGLIDLSTLGGIKAESLPNIKAGDSSNQNTLCSPANAATGQYGAANILGNADDTSRFQIGGLAGILKRAVFDASLSSSTYQDNAPVQQEAIQYPYFIQVATGSEESVDVSTEIQLNNPFSLLDYKWSEYEITNTSWLISDGAFHSGATYVSVYELLLKIKNGTETKEGVSVKLSTEAYEDTDFVLNTTDTTFRLPIKVKLASGNAVAGNGMTLGLTDGTTNYGLNMEATQGYGLDAKTGSYGTNIGTTATGDKPAALTTLGITTDPTKSGIETSSAGLKLYFYVGETVQDANVINAAGVLTRVANSIDRTVASDRETVVGWGMPDYSAGIAVNATSYTAPTDGIVLINCVHVDNNNNNASINGVQVYNFGMSGKYAGGAMTPFETPVSAGDVITSNRNILNFYPLKGVS